MDDATLTLSEFQMLKLDTPYENKTLAMGQDSMQIPTAKVQGPLSPLSEPESSADDYFSSDDDSTLSDPFTATLNAACPSGVDNVAVPNLAETLARFQREMEDRGNARISSYRNTYFFDGGSRFISLPTLGNSNTKAASQISRTFEEWLERKIYAHDEPDTVPILEESVEVSAAEIMGKLKSKATKIFSGLTQVMIRIRAGHIYNYQNSTNSWSESEDDRTILDDSTEDFFQQFPLFVEVVIKVKPSESHHNPSTHLLLTVENAGINPARPFMILEEMDPVAAGGRA
ncbi:hypothetical protein BC938DRAFT_480675 [Jimgerdemannia flammicorona]|uniref:Uncharacterized protein n=1 Tax=Jimgerdemannia flammicorona TaxID=994334 RepID=A0A433QHZ3_9FUNG|nr:hypothetical protein BC938DRAFT_480675 [Jimgerdemannia flammicorona]